MDPNGTGDERIAAALATDRAIDITTVGRKSGRPHRIEMAFHNLDGQVYITGLPGRRDWYANLLADPRCTFHLKESVRADLPARARPVLDPEQRRAILAQILGTLGRPDDLEAWLADSPLVLVSFDQP